MLRVLSLGFLCLLCGCSKAQLEHQSDSFNRASATAISEQVLLNAVRSSLDLPLSFTKLKAFTAGNMANGSFTPKLPFGADAARIYDLGPTLSWSSGVQSIEYVDVNTGTAIAKLNESLQYDAIDRYAREGLRLGLLATLFASFVEIHADLKAALDKEYRRQCYGQVSNRPTACEERARLAALCKHEWRQDVPAILEGEQPYYTYANLAATKCDFLKFQDFLWLVRLSRLGSDLVTEVTAEKLKTPEGKLYAVPKAKTLQGIRFQVRDVQKRYERLEKRLALQAKLKKRNLRPALRFALRSPKALLVYLGELIALQNFASNRFVPEIVLASGDAITLFRVVRGQAPADRTALSVRGPDREIYSVPRPDYGSPDRDHTMRVLAIAGELVNAAISEKDFPAPTSVLVRAIQ